MKKRTFSTIFDVAPDVPGLDSERNASGGSVTAWSHRSVAPADSCYNLAVSEAGADFQIKSTESVERPPGE